MRRVGVAFKIWGLIFGELGWGGGGGCSVLSEFYGICISSKLDEHAPQVVLHYEGGNSENGFVL